jgi:deoxyadenosine/deoxycytidine kinase
MNPETELIKSKIAEVKPRLATLQWDFERNQLNQGKIKYFEELKKEYEGLVGKLKSMQNEDNKQTD